MKEAHQDNAPEFRGAKSKYVKFMTQKLKLLLTFSAPYSPQMNSVIERWMSTSKGGIR